MRSGNWFRLHGGTRRPSGELAVKAAPIAWEYGWGGNGVLLAQVLCAIILETKSVVGIGMRALFIHF